MKLFSAEQIRKIDQVTIESEPIASLDLMERAASACSTWLTDHYDIGVVFHVYCGMGNNGGDGLAICRQLHESGYEVRPYIIAHRSKGSADFDRNLQRLDQLDISVHYVNSLKEIPKVDEDAVAVDAILGIGLDKPLRGIIRDVVGGIQEAYEDIISIDVPTGLPSDFEGVSWNKALVATHTLTFQFPKLSFFLPSTGRYTGDIHVLDIGLDEIAILEEESAYHLITDDIAEGLRSPREIFSHKGDYGHALIVGGHEGMIGAAVLATKACLRSGAGLVTAHVPSCGRDVLQISVPEAMVQPDHNERSITNIPVSSRISAIGVGPGMGREQSVFKGLEKMLSGIDVPIVLDADSLHLIGSAQAWELVPANAILTPHPGEFRRMIGKDIEDSYELLKEAISWSVTHNCILVLKGAYTAVCNPKGEVHFNSTGHPAMATGGSGDVLTGIITGLLAQRLEPFDAARYGVWLHGCTGEEAAARRGEHAVIASDLIDQLF